MTDEEVYCMKICLILLGIGVVHLVREKWREYRYWREQMKLFSSQQLTKRDKRTYS